MEQAAKFFKGPCDFVAGAMKIEQVPDLPLPEIAFAGRSNVGKSSLINAITFRKVLARTSQTPGCTRQINFFSLRERLMLVDLPGYGYAKVSKTEVKGWGKLIRFYLKGRPNLKRVLLLIDVRRGIKDTDLEVMKIMDDAAVTYQIVLTKKDKATQSEIKKVTDYIEKLFPKHPALYPSVIVTSSKANEGVDQLQEELVQLAKKDD